MRDELSPEWHTGMVRRPGRATQVLAAIVGLVCVGALAVGFCVPPDVDVEPGAARRERPAATSGEPARERREADFEARERALRVEIDRLRARVAQLERQLDERGPPAEPAPAEPAPAEPASAAPAEPAPAESLERTAGPPHSLDRTTNHTGASGAPKR